MIFFERNVFELQRNVSVGDQNNEISLRIIFVYYATILKYAFHPSTTTYNAVISPSQGKIVQGLNETTYVYSLVV